MGLLDDAIREHLDLMRRHGANEAEVARQEAEALGPVLREEGEAEESGSAPAETGPSLPYDRAAEAGLTGEPDLPSFEWHGSSTAEPDVPSFISPEPPRGAEPEPDGGELRANSEQVAPAPTEAFGVVEADPALEEREVSVEPSVPEAEGTVREEGEAALPPEPPVIPETPEEAAAPEPSVMRDEPSGPPEPLAAPEPPVSREPVVSQVPPEPVEAPEPPTEPAFLDEESLVEAPPPEAEPPPPGPAGDHAASLDAEVPLSADTPLEEETAFRAAPTEDDLPASFEPYPFESVPGLGTDASEEPFVPPPDEPPEDEATAFHPAVVDTPEPAPVDVEDLPPEPEPEPVPPEGGPLLFGGEESPPEQETPPLTGGEVVAEPPIDLPPGEPPSRGSLEPPIEEPFVAGEEEAWREAGEAPGDVSGSLPEPSIGGASSLEGLHPHPGRPFEGDALFEPAEEPPPDEPPVRGPAPDAELPPSEPLDASLGEPPDAPDEPPLAADPEAARGFFDETAEHERPSREERSPPVDPDFED